MILAHQYTILADPGSNKILVDLSINGILQPTLTFYRKDSGLFDQEEMHYGLKFVITELPGDHIDLKLYRPTFLDEMKPYNSIEVEPIKIPAWLDIWK